MKILLQNYLLFILLSLLTLVSCVEKSTTDSNNPPTTPSAPSLAIDYGISEDFYIALTNTTLELIQKGNFNSQSNFFVSPTLPGGLSLDITNGNIKGTPTNSNLPTPYTITATVDSKTYTKTISLGVAPSLTWVTPVSSNYLKAYVVGDGAKQIDDWTWGSSDENLFTVINGLISFTTTTTGANGAIIYAKKDTSTDSAHSYSNGVFFATGNIEVVNGGKIITKGTNVHLVINSGTKAITLSQFMYKGLTSVVIPNSVTSIGNFAFRINKLTNIIIPDSVTNIGAKAFYQNFALANVVIPNSVTTIGESAFHENFSLTSITIPSNIKNIARYTFYRTQLTNVVIPNKVTNIGYKAFALNQLTTIVIPDSVTNIENKAFFGNTNLIEVSLKQSLYDSLSSSYRVDVFGSQVTNYIKR